MERGMRRCLGTVTHCWAGVGWLVSWLGLEGCDPGQSEAPGSGGSDGAAAQGTLDAAAVDLGAETSAMARLVFVGDVMFDGRIPGDLAAQGLPFDATLEGTRSYVASADYATLNLETSVSDSAAPIAKQYTFNADPSAIGALARAGFKLANLANNHVLDYGPEGLASTRHELADWGMAETGIAYQDEAQTPVIVRLGNLVLGVLGYADAETPFAYASEFLAFAERPARADPEWIVRDLEALRPNVDRVVVQVHWGLEDQPVTQRQRDLGRFMIDHGADVVVGHHPHVQQEAEWYAGGLILYSLGNFVFGLPSNPEHLVTRLYRVHIDPLGVRTAEYLELSIRTDTWAPTPVTGHFLPVAPAP
jgi:poly-gamma-glutamate capsule biosynthesis protein CapA/YwtB (metallophosphatase superfamily)